VENIMLINEYCKVPCIRPPPYAPFLPKSWGWAFTRYYPLARR